MPDRRKPSFKDPVTDQERINTILALAAIINVERWEQDFMLKQTASGDTELPLIDEIATAIRSLQRCVRAIRVLQKRGGGSA